MFITLYCRSLTSNENNTGGKGRLLTASGEIFLPGQISPLNFGEGRDLFARPDPTNVNYQILLFLKAQVLEGVI